MNETIQLLSTVLDATALRQKVLANNLANVNTPGYTRKDVAFRNALSEAMKASHPETKLAQAEFTMYEDKLSPARPDGNNVTLQRELGEMTENSLLYQFSTRTISRKFEGLQKAIRGR